MLLLRCQSLLIASADIKLELVDEGNLCNGRGCLDSLGQLSRTLQVSLYVTGGLTSEIVRISPRVDHRFLWLQSDTLIQIVLTKNSVYTISTSEVIMSQNLKNHPYSEPDQLLPMGMKSVGVLADCRTVIGQRQIVQSLCCEKDITDDDEGGACDQHKRVVVVSLAHPLGVHRLQRVVGCDI